MCAQDETQIAAAGLPQPLYVFAVGRARVDDDESAVRVANHIAVGAGAGHHAGVGRGQALHVREQTHRCVRLPIQRVQNLPVAAGQRQFTKRLFVLHVARLFAIQPTGAWATVKPGLLIRARGQHRIHCVKRLHALQRANGGKDDEKIILAVTLQRVLRAYPQGLELFFVVSNRCLPFRHARHQKRHIKAAFQIAVCHPMREHIDLIRCQLHAARLNLRRQCLQAVKALDVAHVSHAPVRVRGQQHTEFFKTLPYRSDGLGQTQIKLRATAFGKRMHLCIRRFNAAARKHIGAGSETRSHGTPCHQHFYALRAIAQQQNGSSGQQGGGGALGMQL